MDELIIPTYALCRRELVRFLRQKNRVVGALATPIVFWLLIGGGMGNSFSANGQTGYLNYFFPGTILMILLFTAIFSTISVIEDRREGFMQGVLVAPVGRAAIVGGKVLGGALLATGQAYLFMILGCATGIVSLSILTWLATTGAMFIIAVALTALGLSIAWRMSSTQGFHAIMNLFLMPMWFLSGALFPASRAWKGLRWVMLANPLSYGMDGIRRALYWNDATVSIATNFGICLLVSIIFAAVLFALASVIAGGRVAADLQ